MIDGAFLDMFITDKECDKNYKIRSEHSKFTIPTKNECIEMYYNGMLNMHEKPPFDMEYINFAFSKIPSIFPRYSLLVEYIEMSDLSLVLTDEHGLVTEMNQIWSDQCGYLKKELVGKKLDVLQGKDTESDIVNRINGKLKTHNIVSEAITNYKSERLGGIKFTNHVVIKPVYVPNGTGVTIADVADRDELKCYFISWISEL